MMNQPLSRSYLKCQVIKFVLLFFSVQGLTNLIARHPGQVLSLLGLWFYVHNVIVGNLKARLDKPFENLFVSPWCIPNFGRFGCSRRKGGGYYLPR